MIDTMIAYECRSKRSFISVDNNWEKFMKIIAGEEFHGNSSALKVGEVSLKHFSNRLEQQNSSQVTIK